MFAVLLGGATALLPVYAKDILHVGPRGLGILQAALPLGSLLCALILAHRPPLEKAGRALLAAVGFFGVATIGFGLSHWFWFSFLMLFLCGFVDNVSVVVRHTLVQLLTPDEKRGRVSAVNSLFIGTSNELGGFESGFVAHLMGPVFSVVSGGVGTILVVVAVALIWPQIRKYGRLDA
jgi:MFS family permease